MKIRERTDLDGKKIPWKHSKNEFVFVLTNSMSKGGEKQVTNWTIGCKQSRRRLGKRPKH